MKPEDQPENQELRVRRIQNGTVIDHIAAGQALNVLRILGITDRSTDVMSMVMNVSDRKKDIVKIEYRELNPGEVDEIALISPDAIINIIRDYNPNCITNTDEPVKPRFTIHRDEGVELHCMYCRRIITDRIADFLI